MPISSPFKLPSFSKGAAFSVLFFASGLLAAADEAAPQLNDKVNEAIQTTIQPIVAKNDWAGALKAIDTVLAPLGPKSYDRAYLLQFKMNVQAQLGDNAGAAKSLEEAHKIADELGLWKFAKVLAINESTSLELLGKLAMGDAQSAGRGIEQQVSDYDRAIGYFTKLLKVNKNATADQHVFLAQGYFFKAIADSKKVDTALVKQALAVMQNVFAMSLTPKDDHYMMLLSCYQQLGDLVKSAEILEFMLSKNPKREQLWTGLFNAYLALQEDKNINFNSALRAIVTVERAQALGYMKKPKDNFQLAAIYYNTQNFTHAADLLKKGLASGEIENERKNWELYANCKVNLGLTDDAIAIFKEAAKRFPKIGNFDLQIGNLYYERENLDEALKYMKSAVTKQLEKNQEAQTHYFIAFMLLDMKRLEEAQAAAQKAVELTPNKGFRDLLTIINSAIKEREEYLKRSK